MTQNRQRHPPMKQLETVAIVGVGLIGGSVGLALRHRGLARRVVGIGRSAESLKVAEEVGAVTSSTCDLVQGVADAELVIVCTPVEQIAGQVRQAAGACRERALITDAGSTKAQIVRGLDGQLPRGVRFVGSHPLAGSEKSGPATATPDLFEGRVVVVTPAGADASGDGCQEVREFWKALGARVVQMSPEEHDRALAVTSHLPHLVASALAAATPENCRPLTATGWADTTRVAAGDPELWTQIFSANRENVLAALADFESIVSALRAALEMRDARTLREILADAKQNRDAVGN
jgi:prephenate dehydrogenase